MLVDLDAQGRADLAVIRDTRAAAHLLMTRPGGADHSHLGAERRAAWRRAGRSRRVHGRQRPADLRGKGRCAAAPVRRVRHAATRCPSRSRRAGRARVLQEVRASLEQVRALLSPYPEVHFHPGLFPGSAEAVADRRFSFVHLDLDLGESTADGARVLLSAAAGRRRPDRRRLQPRAGARGVRGVLRRSQRYLCGAAVGPGRGGEIGPADRLSWPRP